VSAVSGTLVLPADAPRTTAASVLVEVRDVSLADAPSRVAGDQVQAGVAVGPNAHIPFRVEVPAVDLRRVYALRAHVSLGGGHDRVAAGDYLTTQAHPVLTRGAPDKLLVVPLARA
jgi:putative lipoprotein